MTTFFGAADLPSFNKKLWQMLPYIYTNRLFIPKLPLQIWNTNMHSEIP
jgi:hypothetical protein